MLNKSQFFLFKEKKWMKVINKSWTLNQGQPPSPYVAHELTLTSDATCLGGHHVHTTSPEGLGGRNLTIYWIGQVLIERSTSILSTKSDPFCSIHNTLEARIAWWWCFNDNRNHLWCSMLPFLVSLFKLSLVAFFSSFSYRK